MRGKAAEQESLLLIVSSKMSEGYSKLAHLCQDLLNVELLPFNLGYAENFFFCRIAH